jgi:VIT1/CCC1 family predicted Fe2+/Mn2+ transporter
MAKEELAARQAAYHAQIDPHGRGSAIYEVILGAQDGIVNVLGVMLGVAAASNNARFAIAAGCASALAESLSMGAVAYTASVAEDDRYRAERAREYRHIREVPAIEREEVREIYESQRVSRRPTRSHRHDGHIEPRRMGSHHDDRRARPRAH